MGVQNETHPPKVAGTETLPRRIYGDLKRSLCENSERWTSGDRHLSAANPA